MARAPLSGPRTATPDMVAAANPPEGYVPIQSNSAFGWENGPIFHKSDPDRYLRGFRVAERHINAGGVCHGGMVMTFADVLLASAALKLVDPPMVTVRMTTDFIGPAYLGDWVEGEASAELMDDNLIAVRGDIRVGDRAVAAISGLFKKLNRRPDGK